MLKKYEISCLISPQTEEGGINAIKEKIFNSLQANEGLLISQIDPKKIKLAYPIKKKESAYLLTIEFQIKSDRLIDFEKTIKKEKEIIRYLLIEKKVYKEKKAKTILRKTASPKVKVELKNIDNKIEEALK